ncbi:hypothetical protein HPB50_007502 [Hyalomma asiaticum]|uniref:Uncharacterized protein n=1 Tax=Hyalomma asiaticum TaxID=266040 RepID=A0ACB7TFS9_HYAAI|nr:hypothetical protein HPB50_007502 [Hyalomma asiaticum]
MVLSDLRQAVRNITKGKISREAECLLRTAKLEDIKVRIKWFQAHMGDTLECNNDHNKKAHAAARALTNRAPATNRHVVHSQGPRDEL